MNNAGELNMSRKIVLVILLLLQLGLITLLSINSKDKMSAFRSDDKLINVKIGDVTDFEIQDKEQNKAVSLKKVDNAWVLASEDNFPVSEKKITEFIEKISSINKSWPVATSEETAKTFKVLKDDFNKKITIKKGDEVLALLILGTSPSFNAVHARVDGDVNTYSLQFNVADVSAKSEDWQDKDILRVKKEDIDEIVINSLLLKKDENVEGGFSLNVLDKNEKMNKEGVVSLLDKVTGLRYLKVLGRENKNEYRQDEPYFTFSVKTKDKTVDYRVSEGEEKDLYVLKSSEFPFYFSVPPYVMQNMKKIDRASLVKVVEENTQAEVTPEGSTSSEASPSESITPEKVETPLVSATPEKTGK